MCASKVQGGGIFYGNFVQCTRFKDVGIYGICPIGIDRF